MGLVFSEDIGNFDAADVTLTGDSSGAHSPDSVSYVPSAHSALVTYSLLPNDAYTFVVLAENVAANGKMLDGEVDDNNWWDDSLLPSGDGQPGGDAVLTFDKTGDIPTVSQWGMAAMVLLVLTAGTLVISRHRPAKI